MSDFIETATKHERKGLFLDFDGVLHPAGIEVPQEPAFVWLPMLEVTIAGHPNVGIVASSTWRYMHTDGELRHLLGEVGHLFLGAIPRGPRSDGHRWWLHLNPAFTSHRFLDDDAREIPVPPPAELVVCDPALGLATPGGDERTARMAEFVMKAPTC